MLFYRQRGNNEKTVKISEKLYQGAAAAANATGANENADEPKQGTVHDADYKVEE